MILALDCATKTGWCLLKDGYVRESGVQDFSKRRGESNGAMFLRFRSWLGTVMEGVTFCVYEQAHHRGGAATEICVNLTGRVQEECAARGIEFATIHSGTLKKWACGSGKAEKSEMMKKASAYLDRDPIDDNEADSVIMAMFAFKEYGVK